MVLLKSKGKSGLYLKLEIVKKVIAITAIITGLHWGIYGLAWSSAATLFISYLLDTFIIGPIINYPLSEQLKDIFPSFAAGAAMGLLVYFLGLILSYNPVITLAIQVFACLVLYTLFVWMFQMEELNEIRVLINKKFLSKRTTLT